MVTSHPTFALVALASVAFISGPAQAGPPSTVNGPPVGVADTYETSQDTTLTIAAPGVLVNDSDPDGDPITVSRNERPLHGAITIRASGAFQ